MIELVRACESLRRKISRSTEDSIRRKSIYLSLMALGPQFKIWFIMLSIVVFHTLKMQERNYKNEMLGRSRGGFVFQKYNHFPEGLLIVVLQAYVIQVTGCCVDWNANSSGDDLLFSLIASPLQDAIIRETDTG
ncbi:uncharacterized protein LOC132631828 [Lycium barbarum]|uniref:uncharacterized protein LOC132631828 n=1 Tax=Lycium barbarum TaxID=112863 RepID=UPI00293F6280|nr:uncharacterized protein LOC132631828 [Lycium barbarum]